MFNRIFSPPTLKALGDLVKTCHKYRVGAVLATALIVLAFLAFGVSVAIATGFVKFDTLPAFGRGYAPDFPSVRSDDANPVTDFLLDAVPSHASTKP